MLEVDVTPGGDESVDLPQSEQGLNSSTMAVNQIELTEEGNFETQMSAESVLDRLPTFPYQVFVLSEFGRPIFVS